MRSEMASGMIKIKQYVPRAFSFGEIHELHVALWKDPPELPTPAQCRTLCRMAKDCLDFEQMSSGLPPTPVTSEEG